MPSALIVAAESILGRPLFTHLRERGWEVLGTTHRVDSRVDLVQLDLARPWDAQARHERLQRMLVSRPAVYLFGARPGYKDCEQDPAGTWRINVTGTVDVAAGAIRQGAFVVFPSSSAIFGGAGTENAPGEALAPVPASEYGRQKVATEQAIAGLVPKAQGDAGAAILRITKVAAAGDKRFKEWLQDLSRGAAIQASRDVMLAPVSMACVVRSLRQIGERRRSGTFHLSGDRDVSYYDFARMIASALGRDPELVRADEARAAASVASRLEMGEPSRRVGLEAQAPEAAATDLVEEFRKKG